jgi:adenylate cyclase
MNATDGILARGRVAIARAIDQIPRDLGLLPDRSEFAARKHDDLEAAYKSPTFRYLIRLAQGLLSAGSVDEALAYTLDVAFEALPIHRGYALMRHPDETTRCHVARVLDHVEYHPAGPVPVSNTILEQVRSERVALYTADALVDPRLVGRNSVWAHGTRAAMCAPLWSNGDIIGFLHVDSPLSPGTFNEQDLDFFIALANFATIAVERIREREARRRLQRYHAPAIVQQVLEAHTDPQGFQSLRKTDVTVLFADLVGFTAFAEAAPLADVGELLSGFYERAAEAVLVEGGTVDKFIGDCVMAFFGAPIAVPDHAERAMRCAARIHEMIGRWNQERVLAGSAALSVRVGVHSGPAIVGDVGSEGRVDYTAVGNVVNVAARLQQDVAEPGDTIFSEATRLLLPAAFEADALGMTTLRGLEHGVTAFRVRPFVGEAWNMAL